MPFYRKRRVYRRRRKPVAKKVVKTINKAIVKSANKLVIPRNVSGESTTGFPTTKRVKLRYVDTVNPAGITPTNLQFNLNSIYDPDRTGTGHQPYFSDTWATIYGSYIVEKVRFSIKYTGNTSDCYVTWAVKPTSTFPSTFNEFKEALVPMGSRNLRLVSQNHADALNYTSRWMDLSKILKRKLEVDSDAAAVTASPAQLAVLNFKFHSQDNSTNVTGLLYVEIEYLVSYFGRIDAGSS